MVAAVEIRVAPVPAVAAVEIRVAPVPAAAAAVGKQVASVSAAVGREQTWVAVEQPVVVEVQAVVAEP